MGPIGFRSRCCRLARRPSSAPFGSFLVHSVHDSYIVVVLFFLSHWHTQTRTQSSSFSLFSFSLGVLGGPIGWDSPRYSLCLNHHRFPLFGFFFFVVPVSLTYWERDRTRGEREERWAMTLPSIGHGMEVKVWGAKLQLCIHKYTSAVVWLFLALFELR